MRKVNVNIVKEKVKDMCIYANQILSQDVLNKIEESMKVEKSPIGKDILDKLIENARIAREKQMPICQDTGMAVFFIEIGQDLIIEGGSLTEAINEGVRQGYRDGYLRKSIVRDPIIRENTMDNTPAVIHYDLVEGDKLKIFFGPKGFGSENMSRIKMLKPSDGVKGIKDFVIDTIKKAGPNPCPPVVVGIGIGGTMEKAALLAKKALMRDLDEYSKETHVKKLEEELLVEINELGIGPQGLGGNTTALGVNIEVYPTHIAGLPVAVNINCHVSRHMYIEI